MYHAYTVQCTYSKQKPYENLEHCKQISWIFLFVEEADLSRGGEGGRGERIISVYVMVYGVLMVGGGGGTHHQKTSSQS
jgi:hypothetical protein